MRPSCPHAHQWLRLTLYQWLQPIQCGAPRPHIPNIARRYVSTTSAINRGLRAEADGKERTPALKYRDRSSGRRGLDPWELPEQRKSRSFGAQRGEVRAQRYTGSAAFREGRGMSADTTGTQLARARNRKTTAIYDELSSHVGEAEDIGHRARGKRRGARNRMSDAAAIESSDGRYPDTFVVGIKKGGDDKSNKHKPNRGRVAGVAVFIRNTLDKCRLILRRIQDAEEIESGAEGFAQEVPVETMIEELSHLVASFNRHGAEKTEVQSGDVRRALITVLGFQGKYWTKTYTHGTKTMLFFDEAQGNLRLLRRQTEDNNTTGAEPRISYTPEQQPISEGKPLREDYVQHVRDLLDRGRRHLETIHWANRYKVAPSGRLRPPLLQQEDRVVAVAAHVNAHVEKGRVEWAAVMFALKRELGKQKTFWSIAPPNGTRTMIWAKEEEHRLHVVRKGDSPPMNEDAEVSEGGEALDNSSSLERARYSPVASQPDVGERRSDPNEAPERVRVKDGRTKFGTNSETTEPNSFHDDMPMSVPYTTAASTFMYGANAVLACLSAKKRRCYHLYINSSIPSIKESSEKKGGDGHKKILEQIERLARQAQIPVKRNASPQLLDRLSNRRPNNGVVLETGRVPAPPVLGLGKPDMSLSMMPVDLVRQSAEEAMVNGAPTALPILTKTWRHPFILMLDGILDEGNMGNIIRTAYFYGVDAVAVSKNTCASVNSPIVSKASSGAIEAVQLLSLPQPSNFVYNSILSSWRVYAAVAPSFDLNKPANEAAKYVTHSAVAAASPLKDHPCILMLGSEGEGLRNNLKNRADYFVSIEQGERGSMPGGILPGIGVDSMNVASAAGVLVESFLRKPAAAQPLGTGSALGF